MKGNVFAPDIDIDITFHLFEAGQKLVRSLSNYFCRMDNANLRYFVSSIAIHFAHDGQRAHRII